MAKQEFRDELGEEVLAASGADVCDSGDPGRLADALVVTNPETVIFVKNFETIPEDLRRRLVARTHVILSGDMEGLPETDMLLAFPTRFLFSVLGNHSPFRLEKYRAHAFLRGLEGEARVV